MYPQSLLSCMNIKFIHSLQISFQHSGFANTPTENIEKDYALTHADLKMSIEMGDLTKIRYKLTKDLNWVNARKVIKTVWFQN